MTKQHNHYEAVFKLEVARTVVDCVLEHAWN